jgi:hypothetical protein
MSQIQLVNGYSKLFCIFLICPFLPSTKESIFFYLLEYFIGQYLENTRFNNTNFPSKAGNIRWAACQGTGLCAGTALLIDVLFR